MFAFVRIDRLLSLHWHTSLYRVFTHAHVCISPHVYIYIYIYIYMYTNICVGFEKCSCPLVFSILLRLHNLVYACFCIHVYIYTYTHRESIRTFISVHLYTDSYVVTCACTCVITKFICGI